MAKAKEKLPAPEFGTLPQAVNELIAMSDWAKRQGFMNIHYRLNWALRVAMKYEQPRPDEYMRGWKAASDAAQERVRRLEAALLASKSYLDSDWFPHASKTGADRKPVVSLIDACFRPDLQNTDNT